MPEAADQKIRRSKSHPHLSPPPSRGRIYGGGLAEGEHIGLSEDQWAGYRGMVE